MYGTIEKVGNPLEVNTFLYDLAVEYGIKDSTIRGHSVDGGYSAVLSWYHEGVGAIRNMCFAVTEKMLDAPEYMDDFRYVRDALMMKKQQCRQDMVDLIMQHGSVQ